MLRNTSSHRAIRRASLGGGFTTDQLFAVALGAIIVGALALTIYFGFFGKASPKSTGPTLYKCVKCEAEFPIQDIKGGRPISPLEVKGPMGLRPLDCPKCNAKASAHQMTQCPKCGAYFIPQSALGPRGVAVGQPAKDICPKCQTDVGQWRRDAYEKAKKK